MKKKCVMCGREFDTVRANSILCSDECRRLRVNEGYRKNRALDREAREGTRTERKEVKLSIEKIMKIARDNNISYGKAVEYISSGRIKDSSLCAKGQTC